jgi:hypothetical protein
VWRFEIAPWPERIFKGRYPRGARSGEGKPIPPPYATELQTVMNALNDMNQARVEWDCGTRGLGVLVSDSLMFERGEPAPSDAHLGQVYGLALPLLKRGMPVTPAQLENVTAAGYLDPFRILLLSYHGMKPLSPEVHGPLVEWVKGGGALIVVDNDGDPFNRVRDWWNTKGRHYASPREDLFEHLGLAEKGFGPEPKPVRVGKGFVTWLRENPANLATTVQGDARVLSSVKEATGAVNVKWRETNYLLLRRGPYLVAAGLTESVPDNSKVMDGRFISLFDSELKVRKSITLAPGSRFLLLDLDSTQSAEPRVLASAGKVLPIQQEQRVLSLMVEGVADTPGVVLVRAPNNAPERITLAGEKLETFEYSSQERLLWIRFRNESKPRELVVRF